ncbi:hypothetical protein ACFORO_08430 [Amycolatopsis halotolerans]|uniref:Uncharacterized protein n=1 Tax=Amycolatopsis halotolerans TaxID=330083 RepID=A0ABV7QCZ2_9PSEU
MNDQPWPEDMLDYAAANAADRFDLDQDQARDLVGLVSEALEDGGDAVDDVAWDVHQQDDSLPGEDFVEDVADSLGYDLG